MTARWLSLAALASALALTACGDPDPYNRAGMWQPNGANSRNLAAMVQNSHDLIRGHGDRGTVGPEGTGPIQLLWAGRPAALPASGSQGTAIPTAPAPATPAASPN